ncbi:amidohydrolase [Clostridium coskatii]|uniref:Melamine deaminase n=1 Tax=Clostridium coskatii TaxID=1705578 RepID=A0A170NN23_9CLOT|nr:amidohydrolase [Clostridium coskatii]OAA93249.1 Melamine deaminase [Clostridium coskatii]OBR95368.1 melamine deaminase [Clostridium coskatii]
MDRTIIKNVNIITMNKEKEVIENGVVVINGNIIEDIGKSELLKKYAGEKVIDGNNGILMPGMVNTHTHASMLPFRSLGDDLADRLKKYIFPLESRFVDRKFVYEGARAGIAEMLLGGVTTFADMYYFEDEVARAAKKMGIRAVLGETVLNFPSPDSKESYGGIEYGEEFIKNWREEELITPAIAPHAPYSNDTEHLVKAHNISQKYDIPMMMHVAEMDYETEKYEKEYNMTPVQYLNSIGILDENFVAAHLVNITNEDLEVVCKNKIGIAHNIGANSKGAKGVSPAVKMYKRGMKIGLGTDGPMSGNTLDIITQMSLVGKIHKLVNRDRTLFPASEIIEMATIGGARVLNMDKTIGSIEKGKNADLVIIETKSINMHPIYDYYSAVVYSANPANVDTVIINGKVLVKNRKLIGIDIDDIIDKINSIKNSIIKFF